MYSTAGVLTAYLAFASLPRSVGYLLTRRPGWDRLALAAAEPGVLFTGITIVSAPSGQADLGNVVDVGRPPHLHRRALPRVRGYLLLRGMIDEPDRRARAAAVVASSAPRHSHRALLGEIGGARSISPHHPRPEPSPSPPYRAHLIVNWLAFTLSCSIWWPKRTEDRAARDLHAGYWKLRVRRLRPRRPGPSSTGALAGRVKSPAARGARRRTLSGAASSWWRGLVIVPPSPIYLAGVTSSVVYFVTPSELPRRSRGEQDVPSGRPSCFPARSSGSPKPRSLLHPCRTARPMSP